MKGLPHITKLEEICEELIISDNVYVHEGDEKIVKNTLFGVSSYNSFDPIRISKLVSLKEFMEGWWNNERVYTVKSVEREFKKFVELCKNKLVYLNRHKRDPLSREYKREMQEEFRYRRKVLEDICFDFSRIHKKIKRNVIDHGENEDYKNIKSLTKQVSASSLAKYNPENPHEVSEGENKYSDEELVATALYKSLFENQQVSIVTNDSDIMRIVHNTCNYLLKKDYDTGNLSKYPVRCYFISNRDKDVRMNFDSSYTERIEKTLFLRDPKKIMKPPILRRADRYSEVYPGIYFPEEKLAENF